MIDQPSMPIIIRRRKQVESDIGLSRSAIYNRMDPASKYFDPSFPKPIQLGGNSVGWIDSEVQAWLQGRIEASRKAA
jgi:prophage regulatory protein